MDARAAIAALEWLVEMGADEVVLEASVDRFQSSLKPAPKPAAPPMPPQARPAPARPVQKDDAPALAAACQSLDDIIATLSRFDACPLKKTATNLVFCDGNPLADVMLIGEAPGTEEDIQGKPFVGRSGQLLDRMLKAIGLDRHAEEPAKAVFLSNVIFWRPPGNRKPTEQETQMCIPFIRRAIEIKQPKVIFCVGATSTHILTKRTDGILKLRGQWFDYDAGARKIPMLASLHPAYLLRQPAQKRLSWRDLLSLRRKLDAH
jgi:DNA polymerase